MASPEHQPNRFQLDRLILFTDAVFAIAITLLIIEIKVPQLDGGYSTFKLKQALVAQFPQWLGFFVSFAVIGQYWTAHHMAFGFLQDYDKGLIFLNFFYLMSIVVMPFTTALYSDYVGHTLPFVIYCGNIILTGLLSVGLWWHICNSPHQLSQGISAVTRQYILRRGAVVPVVFTLSVALTAVSPWLARSFFVFIFIGQWLLNRTYARQNK